MIRMRDHAATGIAQHVDIVDRDLQIGRPVGTDHHDVTGQRPAGTLHRRNPTGQ